MKYITVFYAGQVVAELDTGHDFEMFRITCDQEIYNGAYFYASKMADNRHWYRLDGTPVLDSDVPPELKTWVLILS